jgi:hypothetical protein
MVRIRHIQYRAGRGSDAARMSVIAAGKYLRYFFSAEALRILTLWAGVLLEWEIDDTTHQVTVHLTPAEHGGLPLRKPDVGSPYVDLPTICIGKAVPGPRQTVEEITITETEIAIRVPFAFRRIGE